MPKVIGPPKVRFNLFDNNATGETYILAHFQYRKGVRMKYAVGWKIRPTDWDLKKQRAKVSKRFEASTDLNAHLEKIERLCAEILAEKGKQFDPEAFRLELKKRIKGEQDDEEREAHPLTLLQFAEMKFKEMQSQPNAKSSTIRSVERILNLLRAYAKEKKRGLEFSQINDQFFNDFRGWLFSPPRRLSSNYVNRLFRYVKFFMKRAEAANLHQNRAYILFSVKETEPARVRLTFAELEALEALDLSGDPTLEITRDLLLIGCFSGQRWGDFSRFSPEHITEIEGTKVISLMAQKTSKIIHIPLLPTLDRILKKYGYHSPKVTSQDFNEALKRLGQLSGLTKKIVYIDGKGGISRETMAETWERLASHVCRRSFATNFYEAYPHLIDRIRAITGHRTEQMFRKYIVQGGIENALEFAKATKPAQ